MNKAYLLGNYVNGNSWLHHLDSRIKLIWTTLCLFLFAWADDPLSLSFFAVIVAGVYSTIGFGLGTFFRMIRPFVPVILFTFVAHVLFTHEGERLVQISFFALHEEALYKSVQFALRWIVLAMFGSLLTLTTTTGDLIRAFLWIIAPLKRIGVRTENLALMLSIALRFVPIIVEEAERIMEAQRARGAQFESSKLRVRASAYTSLLVPLFISAIRRAEQLSMALEVKGYRGEQMYNFNRTFTATGIIQATVVLLTILCVVNF
ncbi:MAG: energy-coupling factor transporter transmembrane component T family protein [Bacilli bacterium]